MKDLIEKINAEFETFKTESESLIEKGVKAAGPSVYSGHDVPLIPVMMCHKIMS